MHQSVSELHQLAHQIQTLRSAAERLVDLAKDNPSVICNTRRILASIAMLEFNVSDMIGLDDEDYVASSNL